MNRTCIEASIVVMAAAALFVAGCTRSEPAVHAQPAAAPPATQPAAQTQPAEEKPMASVHVFNAAGELVGPIDMPKVVKTDDEWKKQLTPAQYKIARNKGTEPAFCGLLLKNKHEGVYTCICCGLPLFSSSAKFESGTGWPSFFQPIAPGNVTEHEDRSYGMVRVEILCARCDGHLGHVFDDGPRPTGLRFCLNSESLTFTEKSELKKLADPAAPAP